jgi:hypothetical protein
LGQETLFEDEHDLVPYSPPVPKASQFAFGPQDILMRCSASLVFSLQNSVKLLQIRERRFVVIGPGFIF